jgi:hypothetical protein
MTFSLLPVESDIDTPEDLKNLRKWMRLNGRPPCRQTMKWLGRHPSSI